MISRHEEKRHRWMMSRDAIKQYIHLCNLSLAILERCNILKRSHSVLIFLVSAASFKMNMSVDLYTLADKWPDNWLPLSLSGIICGRILFNLTTDFQCCCFLLLSGCWPEDNLWMFQLPLGSTAAHSSQGFTSKDHLLVSSAWSLTLRLEWWKCFGKQFLPKKSPSFRTLKLIFNFTVESLQRFSLYRHLVVNLQHHL